MVDPRITMEEADRGLVMFGKILHTEEGRKLMASIQASMLLRKWDCDRPLWIRVRERIIDYLLDLEICGHKVF